MDKDPTRRNALGLDEDREPSIERDAMSRLVDMTNWVAHLAVRYPELELTPEMEEFDQIALQAEALIED